MKKTKFLALTLVVAIMMMGAGYAYWSQVLTVEGTVDTGELNVIFEETIEVFEEGPYLPNANAYPLGEDKHFMRFSFQDAYPGAEGNLHYTLTNIGTIGAYVDDFKIIKSDLNDNGQWITDMIRCNKITIDGYNTEGYSPGSLQHALNYLNNLDGNKGIFLDQKAGYNDNGFETHYGHPSSRKIVLDLQFDQKADEKSLPEDTSKALEFTIEAGVRQFNERILPDVITQKPAL